MTATSAPRVAHIVAALDIGGVETGIMRSLPALRAHFDYRVFTVRRRGALECGQRSIFHLLWTALIGSWRPDIVITSLWWSHPFGWFLRLLGARWYAFFHSSSTAHAVDAKLLRWAWRLADDRLVDSQATATFMSRGAKRPSHIIPYVFRPPSSAGQVRDIDLVWVGRNSPEKRLDLVGEFIRELSLRIPRGRATLIVAGSAPEFLRSLAVSGEWRIEICMSLAVEDVLAILGRSRFYLLVSDYEGMSMSTIEAVQSGCVPVVRPVGEIGRYLDSSAALFIDDVSPAGISRAADAVASLWDDAERATALATRARDGLHTLPFYVDALSSAIQAGVTR